MPDVSILIPYYNRIRQFRCTLQSYMHFYPDLDFEVIVGSDTPSPEHGNVFELLDEFDMNSTVIEFDRSAKPFRNPAWIFNRLAERAKSEIFHLTCPEVMHCGPILTHALEHVDGNKYIVYGCRTLGCEHASFDDHMQDIDACTAWDEPDTGGWYQHTGIYNRLLHFASVITKADYYKAGGFSEEYDNGIGYEDNDFLEMLMAMGIRVHAFDEPFAAHQFHGRGHWYDRSQVAVNRNASIFRGRWRTTPRVHGPGSVF